MLRYVDLVRLTFDAESDYRLASAVTHGEVSALRGVAFTEVRTATHFILEKDLPKVAAEYLISHAWLWLARGTWAEAVYEGRDLVELAALIQQGGEELQYDAARELPSV